MQYSDQVGWIFEALDQRVNHEFEAPPKGMLAQSYRIASLIKWLENPKYKKELEGLEKELSLTSAVIEARQMKTTQAGIARLEGVAACHRLEHWRNMPRRPLASCGSCLSQNQ